MRLAPILLAFAIAGAPAVSQPKSPDTSDCRKTELHVADQAGRFRDKRVELRKLNQLPSGTAYMAVHRKIGGCEAPLTMVDYRQPRRR